MSDHEITKWLELGIDRWKPRLLPHSTGLSMGELFAMKYNYDLDANAEAHGLSFALVGNALVGGVGTGAALAPQCWVDRPKASLLGRPQGPAGRPNTAPNLDPWCSPSLVATRSWSRSSAA